MFLSVFPPNNPSSFLLFQLFLTSNHFWHFWPPRCLFFLKSFFLFFFALFEILFFTSAVLPTFSFFLLWMSCETCSPSLLDLTSCVYLPLTCHQQTHEPNRPEDFHLLDESESGSHRGRRAGLCRVQSAAPTAVMPEPRYPSNHVIVFTGIQMRFSFNS